MFPRQRDIWVKKHRNKNLLDAIDQVCSFVTLLLSVCVRVCDFCVVCELFPCVGLFHPLSVLLCGAPNSDLQVCGLERRKQSRRTEENLQA